MSSSPTPFPHHLDDDAVLTADLREAEEVLYATVPGGATSWTPPSEQCFVAGGRFVWFVRSVYDVTDRKIVNAGEWSDGRFFAVPEAPTPEELQRALDVLRRWQSAGSPAADSVTATGTVSDTGSVTDTVTDHHASALAGKSIPTAPAAIRGAHPATSGESYGVVGTSGSPSGAGLAAANTAGGPDLVLDGSAEGQADTLLSQGGIDRPSAADETFVVHNTDSGRLHLEVEGDLTANVVHTEELEVNGMTVIDDAHEWLGSGSTVPCASCVTSSDIADGSIGTTDLASGAVTSSKISDAAVGSSKLAAGAVTSSRIAASSIYSGHIVDGIVATADLGNLTITEDKLANDAVTSRPSSMGPSGRSRSVAQRSKPGTWLTATSLPTSSQTLRSPMQNWLTVP